MPKISVTDRSMLHGSSGKALECGYPPTRAIIRASFENSVMGDFHKYKQI